MSMVDSGWWALTVNSLLHDWSRADLLTLAGVAATVVTAVFPPSAGSAAGLVGGGGVGWLAAAQVRAVVRANVGRVRQPLPAGAGMAGSRQYLRPAVDPQEDGARCGHPDINHCHGRARRRGGREPGHPRRSGFR